nr:hypothetical protein [Lachnospiraceae bacterium]
MLKRLICAILVLAMAGSLWYVASINYDSQFAETAEDTKVSEEGQEAEGAPVYTDDGSLTLWYTDEALTDYLTGVALSFEQDRGVKVNVVLKDGVQFLEAINENSLAGPEDRTEPLCDLYITSHDNLLKAYLAGLAAVVNDPDGILSPELYPQTALNAVSCYDHYVAYPLYYETNFFLYNKTYMASIAQNRIEAEADMAEGEEATKELEEKGAPKEDAKEIKTDEGDDAGDAGDEDAETGGDSEEPVIEEDYDPMGEEDSLADQEVLDRLATMIPATIEDIKTFANNYDAPEAVESVFKWDVSDIFYNYFFVGNYMEVGGPNGDNAAVFNIYNKQAVECLAAYQAMNQFFSIDTKVDDYNRILQ